MHVIEAADKISVRLIDTSQEVVILDWPIKNLEYVEELVYSILDDRKVGPVYRLLFGLRLCNKPSLWLAPNIKLQELLNPSNKLLERATLELRMRFRPSSYTKLKMLDVNAFNLIFAQLRYDFIHTKFTNEKRSYILLNDSVLSLIATDLLRHALENNISIDEIFKQVDAKDFIPERASKWQRSLLFHLRQKINLHKSIQIIKFKSYNQDNNNDMASVTNSSQAVIDEAEPRIRALENQQLQVKQAFIETFLYVVCQSYGAETYEVMSLENPNYQQQLQLRVKYNQTKQESFCIVESRVISDCPSKLANHWTELCDIYSICYGTLRQNAIEINRSNGRPFRVEFKTSWHAKSFLSLIEGYYRLMRKWHFSFCRDVQSPFLDHLKKIRCHGPIGYETMRIKLTRQKKPGSFLLRKCMENVNRYMIDVILPDSRLMIDIDFNPIEKVYTKAGFSTTEDLGITIILGQEEYPTLKALVHDLQIKLASDGSNFPPLQLKNWIPPSEYDDCPALLLSISKKKLIEFELNRDNTINSLTELPKFIPQEMLTFKSKLPQRMSNKMFVRLATLNGDQQVIVKAHIDSLIPKQSSNNNSSADKELVLNLSYKSSEKNKFSQHLSPAQLRLSDWIFVKNPIFADTIGLDLKRNSLIQEYYPLGQLDRYLIRNKDVPESMRRSIACQLAFALIFLQDKRIVHGKIRCHNIFIKSLAPVQIKVTDPLGTLSPDVDKAFLPPECYGREGLLNIQEYDSGLDVWAFGTTLWQIYSSGHRPPPQRYANTLTQPPMCPDQLWTIIDSCWTVDPSTRATPQVLYRDINEFFAWERETHHYDYISHCNESPIRSMESNSITDQLSSRTSNSGSFGSLGGDSQANLLPSRAGATTNNTLEVNGSPEDQIHSTVLNRDKLSRWRGLKLFGYRSGRRENEKEPRDRCGSRMSLSTCSSSSDSERTRSTVLIESQTTAYDHDCNIDITKVKFGAEIGRGSCGTVIKGVLYDWNGMKEQVVAIKRVTSTDARDSSSVEDLRREAEILKQLDHENIVKLLGVINETSVSLVLEYLPLGSLLSYIKNSNHDHLLVMPLQKYAIDIAKGMEYLEDQRIVHRDLALRNVLLKDNEEVKICDFGLAQYLGTTGHYKLKTDRALPLRWYAPEALNYWTFNHKTDVWSYGIVLWEIYSGGINPQYSGTYADLSETLKHERLLRPKDCPEAMYNLMLLCWSYDPNQRESFAQIHQRLVNLQANPDNDDLQSESDYQQY